MSAVSCDLLSFKNNRKPHNHISPVIRRCPARQLHGSIELNNCLALFVYEYRNYPILSPGYARRMSGYRPGGDPTHQPRRIRRCTDHPYPYPFPEGHYRCADSLPYLTHPPGSEQVEELRPLPKGQMVLQFRPATN